MERKRFDEVDFAKAIGIIGVVIVHVLTHNLTGSFSKFLWNNLQFVVVAFVFCSGFVLTQAYESKLDTFRQALPWYRKRITRLVVPFWIYLVVHYSLWLIFPNLFSGLGLSNSLDFFIRSALFLGGTNFNFLTLLFIQLMILFPLFVMWQKQKKVLFVYLVFAVFITSVFTFAKFPYDLYRQTMWVPWSLILLLAIYFFNKEKLDKNALTTKIRYLKWSAAAFVGFSALLLANSALGKNEIFYNHKYPPDFYYLLFGVTFTFLLLLIGKFKIWQSPSIKTFYNFISRNSYKIFFIHYVILDLVLKLSKTNYVLYNPLVQIAIILILSLIFSFIFERISKKYKVL